MKITPKELQIRLNWSLDMKIEWFCKIYSEFVIHTKGNCYLSFSGGKDSQIGVDIIDKIHNGTFRHITPRWDRVVTYEKPIKVFSNTGLEYPEIVDHVKTFENVVFIKPKMGFTRVIKEIGVAIISKEVAQKIREIRTTKSEKLRNKRLYGDSNGNGKLPVKWRNLIDAPFLISDKCCSILKKDPFKEYEKKTNKKPIVFTTVSESYLRDSSYLTTGCNTLDYGKEKSRPYSLFTEKDTWDYAKRWGIKFCEVYYDRLKNVKQLDGSFKQEFLEKTERTGCMFCMFGIHLEDKSKNNRIQRIAISHPILYNVIINKCGLGNILKYIGVQYIPKKTCGKQTELRFKDNI